MHLILQIVVTSPTDILVEDILVDFLVKFQRLKLLLRLPIIQS